MTRTRTATLAAMGALFLAGCGDAEPTDSDGPETVQAVATFSVLTDIVEEVGGDHVTVHNLVPIGQDPHEYESSPADTTALSDAEVFFVNGLNLEGGEQGWAARMADSVDLDENQRIVTTEGVEPLFDRRCRGFGESARLFGPQRGGHHGRKRCRRIGRNRPG